MTHRTQETSALSVYRPIVREHEEGHQTAAGHGARCEGKGHSRLPAPPCVQQPRSYLTTHLALGIFKEASSHEHNLSMNLISGPSPPPGEWGMGPKASHHDLFFLVTSPHPASLHQDRRLSCQGDLSRPFNLCSSLLGPQLRLL